MAGVKWHKLGEFIEECTERNEDGQYGVDSVRGISITKSVIETKADMTGVSLKPYKLFKPNEFCFVTVTSRNGGKISLACNECNETFIVSSSYEVFRITSKLLDPEYLSLIIRRSEFDRYARFHSWGSARETFSFEDMCRVEIPVPGIEEQRKVVEVWQRLRKMKEDNEKLAEPLMQLCRSYLQECKKKYEMVEIGGMIKEENKRNILGECTSDDVRGLSTNKELIATAANLNGVKLDSYKIVG
jgi:type I restriction enzyme S subunit